MSANDEAMQINWIIAGRTIRLAGIIADLCVLVWEDEQGREHRLDIKFSEIAYANDLGFPQVLAKR